MLHNHAIIYNAKLNHIFEKFSVFEDKEQKDDNGRRTGNIGLVHPMYLHPLNDPRGWIRYRFMPNQFPLSNRPYINRM